MTENSELFVWEKQPYDTEMSYYCFENYYLTQPFPRYINTAYQKYLIDKHNQTEEEAKDKLPSSTFQKWVRGNDVEGALHWKERASEYDVYVSKKKRGLRGVNRDDLLETELADYKEQLDVYRVLLDKLTTDIQKENITTFDAIDSFRKLNDIRDKISKNGRRGLGLPERVTNDNYEGEIEEEFVIEWSEPFDDDVTRENIGLGYEELQGLIDDDEDND